MADVKVKKPAMWLGMVLTMASLSQGEWSEVMQNATLTEQKVLERYMRLRGLAYESFAQTQSSFNEVSLQETIRTLALIKEIVEKEEAGE